MVEYKLVPVSQEMMKTFQINTEKQFEKMGKQLKPPRYETVLPNKKKQSFEHDETSIADENTSEEEKLLWKQYQKDTKELAELVNQKIFNYAFYNGVECEISDEWKEEMEWMGVVFDNRFDEKVKFVLAEVFKTPQETMDAFFEIMKISAKGVDQAKIESAEATFRGALQTKE